MGIGFGSVMGNQKILNFKISFLFYFPTNLVLQIALLKYLKNKLLQIIMVDLVCLQKEV